MRGRCGLRSTADHGEGLRRQAQTAGKISLSFVLHSLHIVSFYAAFFCRVCFASPPSWVAPMPEEKSGTTSRKPTKDAKASCFTLYSENCYNSHNTHSFLISKRYILTYLAAAGGMALVRLSCCCGRGMARAVCAKGSFPKRGHVRGKITPKALLNFKLRTFPFAVSKTVMTPV